MRTLRTHTYTHTKTILINLGLFQSEPRSQPSSSSSGGKKPREIDNFLNEIREKQESKAAALSGDGSRRGSMGAKGDVEAFMAMRTSINDDQRGSFDVSNMYTYEYQHTDPCECNFLL
jgi:hypothetical protein